MTAPHLPRKPHFTEQCRSVFAKKANEAAGFFADPMPVNVNAIEHLFSLRVAAHLFGFAIAGKPWVVWFTAVVKYLAVGLTVFSGAIYLWRNRAMYLEEK